MPLDGFHYQGRNFAPVKPLQDAKSVLKNKKNNTSSLNAFFREKGEEKMRAYDPAFRETIEQGRIIASLEGGKSIIKRDSSAPAGYVTLTPSSSTAGMNRSNYPLFPQNCEILKSKWQKAHPLMAARHFGNGYKSQIQCNSINTVMKSQFRDIFTPAYELNEASSALTYGTYNTRFFYNDRLNQIIKTIPILKNESKVLMPGYGACLECPFEGAPKDFQKTKAPYPQCPECGSFKTSAMLDEQVVEEPTVVGAQEIVQGDIDGTLLAYPGCRYDPHVFAQDSSFFLYSQYVPLRVVKAMFGDDLEIQPEEAADLGLQVMDALASRGGNIENFGETSIYTDGEVSGERAILRELWLTPDEYAGEKLDKAEETLSGRVPADVPFEKIWPEGVCVASFDGFGLQVGLYAEKANIASGVYLLQAHSGIGKPVSDAVDAAKDLNEIHSMAMAGLKRFGASGLVIDERSGLTQEDIKHIFKPQGAVFVDGAAMNTDDIRKSVMQIQPNPVNPVLPQYAVQISNLLNMAFMTGDFAQGMTQDVDINTFGGQQLAHAKAEEQKGAIITMKVAHRMRSAEIIYDLFRQHIKIPKFYANSDDRQGKTRGKMMSGADMPKTMKFDPVPDSEIPTNTFERSLKMQEMTEKAGGLVPLLQAAASEPKMTAWFVKGFGITDMPNINEEDMQIECLARVENIRELSNLYQDPNEIIAMLDSPPRVRETMHLLKAEFLGEILTDDEIQAWPLWSQQAIEQLIEAHYELEGEAQVRNQLIAMKAQSEVQMAQAQTQQAIAQPQIDAQRNAEQEDQAAGAVQELAGKVVDDQAKQVDHERQMEADDAAGNRQIGLEMVKAAMQPEPKQPAKKAAKG
jgi:uncharacterized protein YjbJ (UPF0337 family)